MEVLQILSVTVKLLVEKLNCTLKQEFVWEVPMQLQRISGRLLCSAIPKVHRGGCCDVAMWLLEYLV